MENMNTDVSVKGYGIPYGHLLGGIFSLEHVCPLILASVSTY